MHFSFILITLIGIKPDASWTFFIFSPQMQRCCRWKWHYTCYTKSMVYRCYIDLRRCEMLRVLSVWRKLVVIIISSGKTWIIFLEALPGCVSSLGMQKMNEQPSCMSAACNLYCICNELSANMRLLSALLRINIDLVDVAVCLKPAIFKS